LDEESLLRAALSVAENAGWPADGYEFSMVKGGTQANVWRGQPAIDGGGPGVAVRLTPKPAALIRRIADLVDRLEGVECPRTLAVGTLDAGNQSGTVHVGTWIGAGAADVRDPYCLGKDIARLHQQLARGGEDFTDRGLSFDRGPVPPAEQELPGWFVARHVWRDRIYPMFADRSPGRVQPIHGDLHWDNLVAGTNGGYGFIDFDKLMHASPAFDLAKLLATGFFQVKPETEQVRFRASRAMDLLAGYQSVRPLTPAEFAAIEGFALVLNEQTAVLGDRFDVPPYRQQAAAVGGWWTRRRQRRPGDPLGLRQAAEEPPTEPAGQQLAFFPDT
jgi:hypothetical protein